MNLPVGLGSWSVSIPPEKLVAVDRTSISGTPSASPRELVRAALEAPFGFEPMRRALTPDDRVAIVLDAELPHAAELLAGTLDHLGTAGIAPSAVTVVAPPGARQDWVEALRAEFSEVTTETHDPTDRNKLAYLATTNSERRVYLNRTVVESDFTVVLTGRRYDPVRNYAGAQVALYPDLADREIRAANFGPFTKAAPWEGREDAEEVAWLLGMPFLIQVIEGEGDAIQEVVAGLLPSSEEGVRRQDARWKFSIAERADAAIATISGDPARITFQDLAMAAACAARCVNKRGRVALLTEAAPIMGQAADWIRRLDDPRIPLKLLMREKPADWAAAKLWCAAARHASLFLASRLPDDLVEEMFATPIHSPSEVQRLVESAGSAIVIPDAHKSKVEVHA